MRGVLLTLTLGALLFLPSIASARTTHCGDISASDIHSVVGHQVNCSDAKRVAEAEENALLTPGSDAKHYIRVRGRRWHYTWRDVNTSSNTQIEYYTASSGNEKVTFGTYGTN